MILLAVWICRLVCQVSWKVHAFEIAICVRKAISSRSLAQTSVGSSLNHTDRSATEATCTSCAWLSLSELHSSAQVRKLLLLKVYCLSQIGGSWIHSAARSFLPLRTPQMSLPSSDLVPTVWYIRVLQGAWNILFLQDLRYFILTTDCSLA